MYLNTTLIIHGSHKDCDYMACSLNCHVRYTVLLMYLGLEVAPRHVDALYVLHETLEFCGVKVRCEGFTAMLCLSQIELSWASPIEREGKEERKRDQRSPLSLALAVSRIKP